MRLVVADVGNTSTAVGLWSDGRVSHVKHVDGPADAALDAVKRLAELGRPDGAAYVSVVPAKDRRFLALFRRLSLPAAQVSHRDFPVAGLSLDYPHPESIGADRLADAAGAVARHGAPVLVMDFGTALTAAVVTRDRVWRGGVHSTNHRTHDVVVQLMQWDGAAAPALSGGPGQLRRAL